MRCPPLRELPPSPVGREGWPWTKESASLPEVMSDGRPWPAISVIIPSYNQGQFLEETLRSVLLQGYPNVEVLVLDGGSTDNTLEVIQKYESWMTYWVSEKDRGQSDAVNKGLQKAQGDIIAWINSDDTYPPSTFPKVASAIAGQPTPSVVFGDCNFVDESSQFLSSSPGRFYSHDALVHYWAPPLRGAHGLSQPSVFFLREMVEKIGFLDESLHYAMDFDFWVRMSQHYPFQKIEGALANCRLHPSAKSGAQQMNQLNEYIEVCWRYAGRKRDLRALQMWTAQQLMISRVLAGQNALRSLLHLLYACLWPTTVLQHKTIGILGIALLGSRRFEGVLESVRRRSRGKRYAPHEYG